MPTAKKCNWDTSKVLDGIERAVHAVVKPYGFKKHGRTLHRFVCGDISQVIHYQTGPAYLGQTHLLWVNIGIRVTEKAAAAFRLHYRLCESGQLKQTDPCAIRGHLQYLNSLARKLRIEISNIGEVLL